MRSLLTSLVVLVVVALVSFGAGWYGGLSLVRDTDARLAAADERLAGTEDRLALLADDAVALREALVEQQLIAAEETEGLRAALDEQAAQQASALADVANDVDIAGLVEAWDQYVYDISCVFELEDGSEKKGGGSATLTSDSGGTWFVTNAHVVEDDDGQLVRCHLERKGSDDIDVDKANIEISDENDVAYGHIVGNPPAIGEGVMCATKPRIGERVIILGYPAIGAKESVTVTEGIISGFDKDYYTTSAKIEKGNSGGAAVSVEHGCFLGLPTLVVAGRIESLARILPVFSL